MRALKGWKLVAVTHRGASTRLYWETPPKTSRDRPNGAALVR